MKTKIFPENMIPLGDKKFNFHCHSGLSCFTQCCKNVDMYLFPYDIIRLKHAVGLDSEVFLREHTFLKKGANPYFPSLMLKLTEGERRACPFLNQNGCAVYSDRPSSCRTYPLERAVDRDTSRKRHKEYYFLTDHSYCLGHGEEVQFTVQKWIRNQNVDTYNCMNDLWAEIESIFLTNPWKGEEIGGPKQQLAFMIFFNIDGFRRYVAAHKILGLYSLTRDQKNTIGKDDAELLKFGFEWLKIVLTGKSNLVLK